MEFEDSVNSVSYNLVLYCTTTDLSEQKVMKFSEAPYDILTIKKQIEAQFAIPICVQVVSYDDLVLEDTTTLAARRIRDGDTFHVKYLEKGHCSEIIETIRWMEIVMLGFQSENPSLTSNMSADLASVLTQGLQEGIAEELAFKYFYPWLDPTKYVNKLHFVYNGGVMIMMDLLEALIQRTWHERILHSQFLEFYLLRVIWNFTETFPLRRAVTRNKGIERCIRCLLHFKLKEGERFEDYANSRHSFAGPMLRDTIIGALGAMCNLSELPECHMDIASNPEAMEQLSQICASPYLPIYCSHYVTAIFLCLAYTPSTHQLISSPRYLAKMLDAFTVVRVVDYDDDPIPECSHSLLRYFTLLFMAQVVLISPQCIPADMHQTISEEMKSLLQSTSYKTIRNSELSQKYVWSTYIPYIKLLYMPGVPEVNGPFSQLQLLSLEIVIFALQNMLGRENHREFLRGEGLLDFVACCPQYVSPLLRPRAMELVRIVVSNPNISEGPPKLLNLVKAQLAKVHFGLERVLSLSVSEIVTEAFNTIR